MASDRQKASSVIGTSGAALILLAGKERRAIITSIHANALEHKRVDRITFVGPVVLNAESRRQVETVVVGLVDRILSSLGLAARDFEVSIANPDVSAILDTGLEITGYSAELPVFMTLLSSSLQIPIPQDIVSTGHLASLDGRVAPVSGLTEKLRAVIQSPSIKRFMYPKLNSDQSLQTLMPRELKEIELQFTLHKGSVEQYIVGDIADAIQMTFTSEGIIEGSLASGFYSVELNDQEHISSLGRILSLLSENSPKRFWNVVQGLLFTEDIDKAKTLLNQFLRYNIDRRQYPNSFGRGLLQLLATLPASIRRIPRLYPVVQIMNCIQVAQYASKGDHSDVQMLFSCSRESSPVGGIVTQPFEDGKSRVQPIESGDILTYFLRALAPETVIAEVLLPIDEARASYSMSTIRVEDYDSFCESICSFYTHLLRHMGRISGTVNPRQLAPDALDLTQRAFQGEMGVKAAYEESRSAARGGLKFVFDKLTDYLKAEEREKYVRMVFQSMIDPLDFETKVAVVQKLLGRLGPSLPEGMKPESAKQYAVDYELIIRAYVESTAKMTQVLRTL